MINDQRWVSSEIVSPLTRLFCCVQFRYNWQQSDDEDKQSHNHSQIQNQIFLNPDPEYCFIVCDIAIFQLYPAHFKTEDSDKVAKMTDFRKPEVPTHVGDMYP